MTSWELSHERDQLGHAVAPNVVLTNNFDDYFNYSIYVAGFGLPPTDPNAYYSLFGNSSLQMSAHKFLTELEQP